VRQGIRVPAWVADIIAPRNTNTRLRLDERPEKGCKKEKGAARSPFPLLCSYGIRTLYRRIDILSGGESNIKQTVPLSDSNVNGNLMEILWRDSLVTAGCYPPGSMREESSSRSTSYRQPSRDRLLPFGNGTAHRFPH